MLKVKILKVIPTDITGRVKLVGEFKIESANIRRSMKEFSHFSFEIKAEDMISEVNLSDPEQPIYAQIYRDETKYADGLVINVRYQKTKVIVECEDCLYALSWIGFESVTYGYQNFAWYVYRGVQIAAIIWDLMTLSNPWSLPSRSILNFGNFFYWNDPHIAINFDMRELEVISDALFKLSDTAGKTTYFQFGDLRQMYVSESGTPARINIGTFERNTRFEYNENNILDIEIEKPHEPTLVAVSAYGGTYENPAATIQIIRTDTGTVPATALDPDYFFRASSNYIELDPIPPTLSYTKEKEIYVDAEVTNKISPNATRRAEATTSLYREAVRILKEAGIEEANNILQISTNVMPDNLMPGNIVSVNYEFKYSVYIPGINKTVNRYMGDNVIDSDYYIQEYDLTLYENDLDLNLVLKSEQSFKDSDYTKITNKQIKQLKKNKEFFVQRIVPDAHVIGLYDVTVGSGLASNTTLLGNPARSTTISKLGAANFANASQIPVGASNVIDYFICTDPEYEDRVNLDFIVPPSGGVPNFSIATQFDDNWTTNDEVRVKILVIFDVV